MVYVCYTNFYEKKKILFVVSVQINISIYACISSWNMNIYTLMYSRYIYIHKFNINTCWVDIHSYYCVEGILHDWRQIDAKKKKMSTIWLPFYKTTKKLITIDICIYVYFYMFNDLFFIQLLMLYNQKLFYFYTYIRIQRERERDY